jgi:23S rRNA pseudouridine1911/1915/1917 synthase
VDIKKLEVVWENDEVMVVNKPNGMVCVRDEALKSWPIIAHRLDKETSGALLMAKNLESLKFLMDQFKRRKVDKEYVALVHGWVEPKEGRIKLPLSNKGGGVRWGVRYDGKTADTAWGTLKRYCSKDGDKFSLLKIKIYTGRTHQIRVHLAHLGYPVFSDSKYLNKKQMRLDRQVLNRHFLHAEKIGFRLPDGPKKEVEVGLPKELSEVISEFLADE